MAIGKFGKYLTFEVYMNPSETSDKKVKCLTFSSLNRKVSSRITKHERITRKQEVQFNGPNLASMTFTMAFSAGLGVNPREMIERLEKCVRYGKTGYFIVGTKKVGKKKYLITDMNEDWRSIMRDGKLVSANVDITMEEYV